MTQEEPTSSPEPIGKEAPAKPSPTKPAAPKPAGEAKPTKTATAQRRPVEPANVSPASGATSGSAPAGFQQTAAVIAAQARRSRARKLARNLSLWVALPTVLGALWFGWLAPAEYESVATLVLTGSESNADQNAILLRERILSREMLTELDKHGGFASLYPAKGLFRKAPAGSERRFHFFTDHVEARYETGKGRVFTLRVRAFSGANAQRIANVTLRAGLDFVSGVRGPDSWYVVTSQPSRPDEPTHPSRARGVVATFFASLAIFAIGSLLIAAVREHAQF